MCIRHPYATRQPDDMQKISRICHGLKNIRSFIALGLVAYLPLLLTQPGKVNADTKQLLYLNPGRLLRNAPFMWDATTGMGTVTHQNIGYLFPTGPFFWLGESLGLPDWVTQRLWMGTLLFLAGAGMLFLARTIGIKSNSAAVISALAYQLSPYSLGYITGASVILLPWVGLPVLLALMIRATRQGGWRHPALIALVVTSVGAVNASSLLYVAIALALWLPCAVWATKELTLGRAAGVVLRVGTLVGVTQLWWLIALLVDGRYGLPILRTTETIEHVSTSSSAPEILRGLGYWFFYGGDNGGLWLDFSQRYQERLIPLGISLMLPLLALFVATILRWKYRVYLALLMFVGTVLAVGAFPYRHPSPLGTAFKDAAATSDFVLSLRNTQRAVPLVALVAALFIGAGLSALSTKKPRLGFLACALVGVIIVANISPLWTGDLVSKRFHRPEQIPNYWDDATKLLGEKGDSTRILEVPGSDFAAYRWGHTLDPITSGLTDRPVVSRELVPMGSPGTVSLLSALDRRMQEGSLDANGIGPVARLISAGDILARFDLEYERYRTPRPWLAWALFSPALPGLDSPIAFGPVDPPNRAVASLPLIDEITLATEPGAANPPPLAVIPVSDPLPIVHSRDVDRMQLLDGDGEGIVDAAESGLLDPDAALVYAGSIKNNSQLKKLVAEGDDDIIITDSNRRRAKRWLGLRENGGYTEYIGEVPLRVDPTDARIPLFKNETASTQTVVVPKGAVRARASSYGDPIRYAPHARPSLAIDQNPDTAWTTGAFSSVIGERILLSLDKKVRSDHITLLQPQGGRDRYITRVRLTFDDQHQLDVDLGEESYLAPGQRVEFPEMTFSDLSVEILSDGLDPNSDYSGLDGVGFSEISIGGFKGSIDEITRLPEQLSKTVPNDLQRRMAIAISRQRADPREPVLKDTEEQMTRSFTLASSRAFGLSGQARISAYTSDSTIDGLVGTSTYSQGALTANSSARLSGEVRARSSAAIDGDLTTHWSPGFLGQAGHWAKYTFATEQTIDRLDLQVVRDGRHSVPTRLHLEGSNGETRDVNLPSLTGPISKINVPTPMSVNFPAITSNELTITVSEVEPSTTTDWYTRGQIEMPFAIAEFGIPGIQLAQAPQQFAPICRENLITLDGKPLSVRIEGTSDEALNRDALRIVPCGPEALVLESGEHEIRTQPGKLSGIDIDRLVLTSAKGGGAASIESWSSSHPTSKAENVPTLKVTTNSQTKRSVTITPGSTKPFWLVLGESHNKGWKAHIGSRDLGPPTLIDGYANGWLIDVDNPSELLVVDLEWAPQKSVWMGITASLFGLLACFSILGVSFTRSRRQVAEESPSATSDLPSFAGLSSWEGHTPKIAVAVASTLAIGALGIVVSRPIIGITGAILTFVGFINAKSRSVLSLATFGSLAIGAAYIGIRQIIGSPSAESAWPGHFETAHWLSMAAVLFLLGHTLVEFLRGPTDSEDNDDKPPPKRSEWLTAISKRFPSSQRFRYLSACAYGSFFGLIVFVWMLTTGSWNLFAWKKMGNFYDAQALAFLDGRWNVPQQVLGIEAFTVDGKSYLYQGPVPALLRVPIMAFGDYLDGRLTQVSMLIAYVVIMAITARLAWFIRQLMRGDEPLTMYELIGIGSLMGLLGGGSSLVYLASRAWVYHEALMWGVAFSLGAIYALICYITKPTGMRLALVSLLTAAALGSRASIGLGPLVGLSITCVFGLIRAMQWRARLDKGMVLFKKILGLGIAPVFPLGVYALVNFIKFGTLFSVPFANQGFTLVDPARQEMLAANNGTLFGLKFIPTTLWHYLDPTALGLTRRFPFIDFPPLPGRIIGDVQFDLIDRTASVTTTLPILCLLSVLGIMAIIRTRQIAGPDASSLRILRVPLLGALAGGLTILPFGYIAHRYLADLFPFFVVSGLVGFNVLARRRLSGVAVSRAALVVVVSLGVFTTGANLSLATIFQRAFSPDVPPSVVAGLVGFQQEVDSWTGRVLGGFKAPSVQQHAELPLTGASGSLVIVGDCDGLYLNDGMIVNSVKRTPWVPVERTLKTGLHRAKTSFDKQPKGTSEEIFSFEDGVDKAAITATHIDNEHLRFELSGSLAFGWKKRALPVYVEMGRTYLLEVVADASVHSLIVKLDDQIVLETFYWYRGEGLRFPSRFQVVPTQATLCQKVRAAAGLVSSS